MTNRLVEEGSQGTARRVSSRGNYAGVMTKSPFLSNSQREFLSSYYSKNRLIPRRSLMVKFASQRLTTLSLSTFISTRDEPTGRRRLSFKASKSRVVRFLETLADRSRRNSQDLEGAHALGLRPKSKMKFLEVDAWMSRCGENLRYPLQI